jgi:hypothetical protein
MVYLLLFSSVIGFVDPCMCQADSFLRKTGGAGWYNRYQFHPKGNGLPTTLQNCLMKNDESKGLSSRYWLFPTEFVSTNF